MRGLIIAFSLLCVAHSAFGADDSRKAPFPELETYLGERPAEQAKIDARHAVIAASDQQLSDNLYPEIRVRVTSPRHTILSSQAAGRVDRVVVRDGDRFEAGEILIAIDPTFEEIQLKKAAANLRRAELLYKMNEEMVALQTKGELELELARADMEQAAAEVEYLEARLARMRVTVPFAGRVGEVFVKELQVVAEGQPLLEILDDTRLELEFIIASKWLTWIKPGLTFGVHIDETGKRYQAVLERLGGKVDPLSKSVNAYAVISDPDNLLMEGMSGEAFIRRESGDEP